MPLFKKKTKTTEVREALAEASKPPKICGILFDENRPEAVTYGLAKGFFEFRGVIYFRPAGESAKAICDFKTSFVQDIKIRYPEEFEGVSNVEISKLLVSPLVITDIIL